MTRQQKQGVCVSGCQCPTPDDGGIDADRLGSGDGNAGHELVLVVFGRARQLVAVVWGVTLMVHSVFLSTPVQITNLATA